MPKRFCLSTPKSDGMLAGIFSNREKPLPLNNRMAGLGDSLTAAAFLVSGSCGVMNYYAGYSCGAYLTYAQMLPKTGDVISQGLLLPGSGAALSGASTAVVYATYYPQIFTLNPNPGICAVLCGTNDLADYVARSYTEQNHPNLDGNVNTLKTMYQGLLAAKILPIACGIPTIGVEGSAATRRAFIPLLNSHIQAVAQELNIPFIDFFPLTDNGTDGWKTDYCGNPGAGDNHPSVLGATVMGQALRDLLNTNIAKFTEPNLVTAEADATSDLLIGNGAFMRDTNSDGIPDMFGTANGWDIPTGSAEATRSFVAEPGVVSGNWWRINKTAKTATTWMRSVDITIPEGQKFEFGFMLKVLNPDVDADIQIQMTKKNDATTAYADFYWHRLGGNVAPYKTLLRGTGKSGTTILKLNLLIKGIVDFYIGQLTLRKV